MATVVSQAERARNGGAADFQQASNQGRFAIWLRVDSWGRPTIGRSFALDMGKPFQWLPLTLTELKRYIRPAAYRIAHESDAYSPTFAVVSTKGRVPVIYVRSKTAQSLRQCVSGLLTFAEATGYRMVQIDITKPAADAIASSEVISKRLKKA
jgi:hypothetical protein